MLSFFLVYMYIVLYLYNWHELALLQFLLVAIFICILEQIFSIYFQVMCNYVNVKVTLMPLERSYP